MMYRSGRHPVRYIPVGFVGSREKYGVDFNGNLFGNVRAGNHTLSAWCVTAPIARTASA